MSAPKSILFLAALVILPTEGVLAQIERTAGEWAWKALAEKSGLELSYIFYPRADTEHNGVVVKLVNTTPDSAEYSFEIVFRNAQSERVYEVNGVLAGHEVRTGDADGLFFIPYYDGQEIDQIGVRKLRFWRGNTSQ